MSFTLRRNEDNTWNSSIIIDEKVVLDTDCSSSMRFFYIGVSDKCFNDSEKTRSSYKHLIQWADTINCKLVKIKYGIARCSGAFWSMPTKVVLERIVDPTYKHSSERKPTTVVRLILTRNTEQEFLLSATQQIKHLIPRKFHCRPKHAKRHGVVIGT